MSHVTASTTENTTSPQATSTQDVMTDILRQGTRQMLAVANEAEVDEFFEARQHLRDQ